MKEAMQRLARLFIGLFLYAVGIVMTVNANMGLAPWDVFHQGLSKLLGITMGQASISVGITIVTLNFCFGEKVGLGTIFNMIFIGLFFDILMINHVIPVFNNVVLRFLMMLLGMFTIGVATFFYLGAGMGSGPRDGLMVALTKKTGKSVRFIRNSIEVCVLGVGYLFGGFVSIGTLIMAVTMGYFVQFAFKLFKFDVKAVKHRFINNDIAFIKAKLFKRSGEKVDLE